MSTIERRKVINSLLFAAVAIGGFPIVSAASTPKKLRPPDFSRSLMQELTLVNQVWFQKFGLDPRRYIRSIGLKNKFTPDQLSAMTVNDFENEETIEVEGLILGKTESAILACLFLNLKFQDDT